VAALAQGAVKVATTATKVANIVFFIVIFLPIFQLTTKKISW